MYPAMIQELLAAERRNTMHAEADAFRLAKQAREMRRPRRDPRGSGFVGTALAGARRLGVRIRRVEPDDASLISDGFARLSEESRRLRFLGPKARLSSAELRYFTEIDHHNHEALIAVSRLSGRGLGVARFIRLADDPTTADLAVVVADEWQQAGLGTALVARLVDRARCEGIARFSALLSSENEGARRLLRRTGTSVRLVGRDAGTMSYEMELTPLVTEPRRALRARRVLPAPADCVGAA
jgi:RimJ/RimL family protein N-acetyltransferase